MQTVQISRTHLQRCPQVGSPREFNNESARPCAVRLVLVVLSALIALFSGPGTGHAEESHQPDATVHAGTLRWALNDQGSELLQLSQNTREQLAALATERNEAGQRLLQTAQLTAAARRELIHRWIADTERQGQRLLTQPQRDMLLRLTLAREGLVTLARNNVATKLSLDPGQRERIQALIDQHQNESQSFTLLRRQLADQRLQRQLQAVLTQPQMRQWEQWADVAAIGANQQPPEAVPPRENKPAVSQVRLKFNFDGAPWRTVLDWLAEQAELSLYVGSLPAGSLTYSDKREFTPDQAIDRINRFLIPIGYTLIRSGKLISVVGLDDGRRDELLEALAESVEPQDLDLRGTHEVLKCIFAIEKADPKEALAEIRSLVKLSTPVLLPKSKQLIVIETAGKLRMIRAALKAMDDPSAEHGPVRRFTLQRVSANEVIAAVRPLVGIDDESSNIGQEVSLSTDPDGKQLFATGSAAQLAIVEGVVKMLDESADLAQSGEQPILRAHPVTGGALQTADDVLQTMLMGERVRLAQEPKTQRIIALATPAIHKRIEDTIAQLQQKSAVFEVIQLRDVAPYFAVSVVREMLDIPFFVDEEDEEKNYPRLDYDTFTMRVFVRGTPDQVAEVKQIVEQLEQPKPASRGPIRLLPVGGQRAQQLLETARRFWKNGDDVHVFPPAIEKEPSAVLERVINGERPLPPATQPSRDRPSRGEPSRREPSRKAPSSDRPRPAKPVTGVLTAKTADKLVSTTRQEAPASDPSEPADAPPIRAQVTPRGILLQSDDPELLSQFEEHLRKIAGPGEFSAVRMAVFYLKFVSADDAKSMLTDVRRGQSSSRVDDDELGDDVSGPRRPGSNYGSLFGPSITADARLNRLIVQGTTAQILQIEQNLQVIDRDRSLAEVQVRGKPQVLRLVHIRAEEAAALIQDTYAGQIASAASTAQSRNAQQQQQAQLQQIQLQQLQQQAQQQQQQQQQQTKPQDQPPSRQPTSRAPQDRPAGRETRSDASGDGRTPAGRPQPAPRAAPSAAGQGQQSQTREPTMTLAIDERSNSLIIRAPDQLFQEVAALVELIDRSAPQTTRIVTVRGVNPAYMNSALQSAISELRGSTAQPAGSRTPPPSRPPVRAVTPSPPPANNIQRIFFDTNR